MFAPAERIKLISSYCIMEVTGKEGTNTSKLGFEIVGKGVLVIKFLLGFYLTCRA